MNLDENWWGRVPSGIYAYAHCAHTAATLAQVRRYIFKHNGSAIDTRAAKNTHARAHTP